MTRRVGVAPHSASSISSKRSAIANSAVDPAPASRRARDPAGSHRPASNEVGEPRSASWIAPKGRSIANPCAPPARICTRASPSAALRSTTSVMSRDFPLPASPNTRTAEPRPAAAPSTIVCNARSSSTRPTNGVSPPPRVIWRTVTARDEPRSVRARTTSPTARGLMRTWTPSRRAATMRWASIWGRPSPPPPCSVMATPRSCSSVSAAPLRPPSCS